MLGEAGLGAEMVEFQTPECASLPARKNAGPCYQGRLQASLNRRKRVGMRESKRCKWKGERWAEVAAGQTPEMFPELVRSNSKLIYSVSLGILKNHADAEDNLHNVLLKAYRNIHRFEG